MQEDITRLDAFISEMRNAIESNHGVSIDSAV